MNDTAHIKIRLNKWFSGLPLEKCQKAAPLLSALLSEFDAFKEKRGNQCKFSPCHRHEYSRDLCARHYQQVRRLRSLTGEQWTTFVRIGLCGITHLEARWALEAAREPDPSDPLRVLIR